MSSDTIPIDPNAFLPNDDSTTTTTIPPSILIGWFAALIGALGFGSFAVPIKGDAANSVDVDPLVMQSYKIWTTMMYPAIAVNDGRDHYSPETTLF
eukprot:scaffold2514_cov226-Alexandrium_tamarense.AAC.8